MIYPTMGKKLAAILMIASPLLLTACSDNDGQAAQQRPPTIVNIVTPREATLQETVTMAGSLVATQQALLSSEREGIIRKIFITGGQQVKTGQRLIQINNETATAELKRAKSDVKLRREESARAKSLLKRQVNSQYDVDKALAQLDTALANEEIVLAELNKRLIKAPFSGQLGIRKVNVGSYVKKGEALIELVSLDPLYVDFKIPETAISSVKKGDKLVFNLPALPALKLNATVRSISPSVNPKTRTIAVRATVENSEKKLKPGLFAKIKLPIKSHAKVLWLPETAIFQEGDNKMVMLNESGKARRVKVEVLSYQNGEVAISDGISAADIIVSEGHHKVPFDGMAIMTTEQMMQSMGDSQPASDDASDTPAESDSTSEQLDEPSSTDTAKQ